MKLNKTLRLSALAAAVALQNAAVSASATLEEIVVTTQKRAQSMQDVPVSVSAFDGEELNAMGALDSASIVLRTPGLNGSKDGDSQQILTIRGVGTGAFSPGADNSVGTYYNEIPISRNIGGQGLLDVGQIEVVKGPQGTLFGRNTSSGAISITNNPADLDENSLKVIVGVGNEGQQKVEAVGNYVVSDTLALRVAGKHDERDGLYEDINGEDLNGRDHDQYRFSMQWEPSDSTNVKAYYEHYEFENRFQMDLYFPESGLDGQNSEVFADHSDVPNQSADNDLFVANITHDLTDDLTLTSNTGYFDSDVMAVASDLGFFFDPTIGEDLRFYEPWEIEQWSQDFRINGSTESTDWFVGVSYYKEDVTATSYIPFSLDLGAGVEDLGTEVNQSTNETESWAVFGDVIFSLTDELTLTVGARYTMEEKEMTIFTIPGGIGVFASTNDMEQTDSNDWTSFDPRVAVDYQLNEDTNVYFSYSKGFKSGGFSRQSVDPNGLAGSPNYQPGSFDPEENDAYEIGVKADIGDRIRLNAAVFYYDYSDFQVESNSGLSIVILNAANLESKGFELDGTFLIGDNLDVRVAYAYLDSKFVDGDIMGIDVAGETTARSPENTFAISATHHTQLGSLGELTTRLEYNYVDERNFVNTGDATFLQGDYSLINLRMAFQSSDETWGLALVGENIGDEEYIDSMIDFGAPMAVRGSGALWRVEANYNF